MQNMSGSQLRESFAFSRRNAVLFCAVLLALACALVALAPGQAHAKSYTMPKVDIQAQVETDGALQVTEQRTFDFDGDFSAVWWTFDGLPQNASLKINGVRMANVDADGTVVGDWTTLPSEAFRCFAISSASSGLTDPENKAMLFCTSVMCALLRFTLRAAAPRSRRPLSHRHYCIRTRRARTG